MTHHWGSFTDDPSEERPYVDQRSQVAPDKELGRCPNCGKKVGGFMDDTIGECRHCRIKHEDADRRAELESAEFRKEQMHRDIEIEENEEDSQGYTW